MQAQNAQIASHLKVEVSQLLRVEEWASVFFVVISGVGARFVSKRVVVKSLEQIAQEVARKLRGAGLSQAQAWTKYGKARVYVWEREFVEVKLDGSVNLASVASGTYKSRVILACHKAGIACGYKVA